MDNTYPPVIYSGVRTYMRDLRIMVQKYAGKKESIKHLLPDEVMQALEVLHKYEPEIIELERKIRTGSW